MTHDDLVEWVAKVIHIASATHPLTIPWDQLEPRARDHSRDAARAVLTEIAGATGATKYSLGEAANILDENEYDQSAMLLRALAEAAP